MKPIRTALMLAFAVAAMAVQADDKTYTLRRTLVDGEKTKYTYKNAFDADLDLSSVGAPNMAISVSQSMTLTFAITKPADDKKSATLTVMATDIEFTMEPAMPGAGEMPKSMSATGKISERNEVSDMKVEGATEMMKMMGGSTIDALSRTFTFPEKALKAGDTWEVKEDRKGEYGTSKTDAKATFAGVEKMFDMDVAKITFKGTNVSSMESEGMGMGPMKSTVNVTLDAVMYFELSTGRLVKTSSTSQPIEIMTEMSGMNLPMKGTYSTEMVMADKVKKDAKPDEKSGKSVDNSGR